MSFLGRLSRLDPKKSLLLLCDMQEKFRPTISYFPQIISNTTKVMKAASLLDVPMEATEQYPKGLGPTVEELQLQKYGIVPHSKTQFSMLIPELLPAIESKEFIILCGIESHACILNTVLDLAGTFSSKEIHIPVDCVSSRSLVDRKLAFKRMDAFPNVTLTSVETLILELLQSSSHPQFRACQRLINSTSEDTGLLDML